MADKEFEQKWAEFLAAVKPRRVKQEKEFARLETEFPFKHVGPFGIRMVESRAGNVQIMGQRWEIQKYARDKRAHPEKPAYQNMRRKYHAERNDIALEISRAYTG